MQDLLRASAGSAGEALNIWGKEASSRLMVAAGGRLCLLYIE